MKTIKLLFLDFWGDSKKNDFLYQNPLYRLLSKKWNLELSSNPDFVIYSYRGLTHLRYDCVRIFYTGENIRPNFSRCDYSFSFDYPTNQRNYRLPLYRLYDQYDLLFKPRNIDEIVRQKKNFCGFVYSNPKASERVEFFNLLSKYKKVDSGGRVFNNIGYFVTDKISWLNSYKFSIAFENSSYPGYTTEKLLHALIAGTVPIYWGNPIVGKDFNISSFVNCHDYASLEEVVERIIEIDTNERLFRDYLSQPWLPDNSESHDCKEENILARFERIFASGKAFISIEEKSKQKKLYYLYRATQYLPVRIRKKIKPILDSL